MILLPNTEEFKTVLKGVLNTVESVINLPSMRVSSATDLITDFENIFSDFENIFKPSVPFASVIQADIEVIEPADAVQGVIGLTSSASKSRFDQETSSLNTQAIPIRTKE